jgi:hypothetical protein
MKCNPCEHHKYLLLSNKLIILLEKFSRFKCFLFNRGIYFCQSCIVFYNQILCNSVYHECVVATVLYCEWQCNLWLFDLSIDVHMLWICVFVLLLTWLFFCNQVFFSIIFFLLFQYPVRFRQWISEIMNLCIYIHSHTISIWSITISMTI